MKRICWEYGFFTKHCKEPLFKVFALKILKWHKCHDICQLIWHIFKMSRKLALSLLCNTVQISFRVLLLVFVVLPFARSMPQSKVIPRFYNPVVSHPCSSVYRPNFSWSDPESFLGPGARLTRCVGVPWNRREFVYQIHGNVTRCHDSVKKF